MECSGRAHTWKGAIRYVGIGAAHKMRLRGGKGVKIAVRRIEMLYTQRMREGDREHNHFFWRRVGDSQPFQ